MSKIRAFTYNNGPAIGNNGQLGDLAIGRLGDNYDTSPGGKTWWGGADENQFYYIVKDVPASNFPTPVGNLGSAQFWGFERETAGSGPTTGDETNFINLTNNITNNSFVYASSSGEYLFDNGYYTNYPYPIVEFDSFPVNSNYGTTRITYGETNEELYFIENITAGNDNNNPSVAIAEYNGGSGGQDYSYSGSLPPTGSNSTYNRGFFDLVIDNDNNYLYSSNGKNAYSVVRYNLNNKTITHSTGSSTAADFQYLALDVDRDRLYNIRNGYELRMYSASTLEHFGDITGPNALAQFLGMSINPNNGDLLVLTQNNFIVYKAADIYSDYNGLDSRTTITSIGSTIYPQAGDYKHQIAWVPSENAWYVRTTTPLLSPKNRIYKYTSDHQVSYIDLGNAPSQTDRRKNNIIYDSVRDLLWTFGSYGELLGINPSTLDIEVEKTLQTSGLSDQIEYNPNLSLDEVNGILFTCSSNQSADHNVYVWDLQEIFPI